jgi:hypothetical protein
MCMHVQNLSLSVLGTGTGLTGNIVSLTGMPDEQTGLTGLADPNSHVPENSASNSPEHDKTDVIDWRRPTIDYLQDLILKVDRKI